MGNTLPREYLGLIPANASGSRTFDIIGFHLDQAGLTLCTRCYLDPASIPITSDDDSSIDDMGYAEDQRDNGSPGMRCDVCGHRIQPDSGPYIGCDDDIAEIRLALAGGQ